MGYDEDGEAVFVLQSPEILDQLGCIIIFLHLHAQDGDIVDDDDVSLTGNCRLFNISNYGLLERKVEVGKIVGIQ